MAIANEQLYGTGRRKTSVARVRLVPGNGRIVVNGKSLEEYFGRPVLQTLVGRPWRPPNPKIALTSSPTSKAEARRARREPSVTASREPCLQSMTSFACRSSGQDISLVTLV